MAGTTIVTPDAAVTTAAINGNSNSNSSNSNVNNNNSSSSSNNNNNNNIAPAKSGSSLSAARALFEQNIAKNAATATATTTTPLLRPKQTRRVSLPPSQKTATTISKAKTTTKTTTTSPKSRRQTMAPSARSAGQGALPALQDSDTMTSETMTSDTLTSLKNTEDEVAAVPIPPPLDNNQNPQDANDDHDLQGVVVHGAASKIQRVTRQWSRETKVRRGLASQQFQQLQSKRELDWQRLQQIKQGRQVKSVRSSLAHFEHTIQKNKQFGFYDSSAVDNNNQNNHKQGQSKRHASVRPQEQEQQRQQREQTRRQTADIATAKDLEWRKLQATYEDEETEEEEEEAAEGLLAERIEKVTSAKEEGDEEEVTATEEDEEEVTVTEGEEEVTATEEEEEEFSLEEHDEIMSMTLSQLQEQHDVIEQHPDANPAATNTNHARPQRLLSVESTLSPIREPASAARPSLEYSMDPPIPKVISIGAPSDAFHESEISLQSKWAPHPHNNNSNNHGIQKQESSRWLSQPVSPKKNTDELYWDKPICFRTPQPSNLRQPDDTNSRWAVHPRVVYGKPKTQKAVQLPGAEDGDDHNHIVANEARWAATVPAGKKKKPVFPPNTSRWTAQVSKRKKGLPHNGRRVTATPAEGLAKPARQITRESIPPNGAAPTLPRKPKRQATQESLTFVMAINKPRRQVSREVVVEGAPLQKVAHVTRPHRKRSMSGRDFTKNEGTAAEEKAEAMKQTNSMPMMDRSSETNDKKEDEECIRKEMETSRQGKDTVTTMKKKTFNRLRNRSLSLGEVKRIVSATRVQAFARMFLQRYQHKMERQRQLKTNVEKETQAEIAHIQECLKLRLQSIRDKMERDHSMGLDTISVASNTSGGDDDDVAAALRTEMAAIEAANNKLQSQCDRLRTANTRMESGSKMRENAIREVTARLKKLQHIQTKLNKVYAEFQAEYKTAQTDLDEANRNLKKEAILQDKTKKCIRKIITFVRPKLTKSNCDLMEELEDAVPVDCLM